MRALLVNPPIHDFAAFDLWSKPLGLLSIAGALRARGDDIDLLDCLDRFHPGLPCPPRHASSDDRHFGSGTYYSEEIPKPPVFKAIPRRFKQYGLPTRTIRTVLARLKRPDIILVTSGMTYWYTAVADTIRLCRETFPGVPVMLGGNYATLCFDHARCHSGADHVHKGAGLENVLDAIDRTIGRSPDKSRRQAAPTVFPAYDLYATLPYVTLKTSHGCPFRCAYCGWHLIDERFSRQDVTVVIDEIDHFYRRLGVRNFAFYDDALLYDAENHFMKIAEGILRNGIAAHFMTPNGLHNRFLTAEVARLMKMANFAKPRLALETIIEARQHQTGGKTTNGEFLQALGHLLEAGYRKEDIGVNILVGLCGQSPDEIEASIRFVADLGLRMHLEEYSPIPGTPAFADAGLADDADPLLHNNSAFILRDPAQAASIQRLKLLAHRLAPRIAD